MKTLFAEVARLMAVNAKHRKGWRMQDQTPHKIVSYAEDELRELAVDPLNRDEIADVLGCLVHLALQVGMTEDELERRTVTKLAERFEVEFYPGQEADIKAWCERRAQESALDAVTTDSPAAKCPKCGQDKEWCDWNEENGYPGLCRIRELELKRQALTGKTAPGQRADEPMTVANEMRCVGTETGKTAGCGGPCVYDGVIPGAGLCGFVVQRFRCLHCGRRWAHPVEAPELARQLAADVVARLANLGVPLGVMTPAVTMAQGNGVSSVPPGVFAPAPARPFRGTARGVIVHFGLADGHGKSISRDGAIEMARGALARGEIGGPLEITEYPDGTGKIVASVRSKVDLLAGSPPCKSFTIEQLERNEHLAPPPELLVARMADAERSLLVKLRALLVSADDSPGRDGTHTAVFDGQVSLTPEELAVLDSLAEVRHAEGPKGQADVEA